MIVFCRWLLSGQGFPKRRSIIRNPKTILIAVLRVFLCADALSPMVSVYLAGVGKKSGISMRKTLLAFILIFCFRGVAYGDTHTYFVSQSGNNANDGSAADDAHAWKTLSYAIDNHGGWSGDIVELKIVNDLTTPDYMFFDNYLTKHNNINFVIEPSDGLTKRTTTAGGDGYFGTYIGIWGCTSGSITIRNVNFTTAAASWPDMFIRIIDNKGMNVTIEDSNITYTGTLSCYGIDVGSDSGTAARNITLSNVMMSVVNYGIRTRHSHAITLTNTSITTTSDNGVPVYIDGNIASLDISGGTLTAGAKGGDAITQTAGTYTIGYCRLSNDYITAGRKGVYLLDGVGQFYMRDCNITSSDTNLFPAVCLGEEIDGYVGTGFGQIEISDCNILSANYGALWLYNGADGAVITRNKTKGYTHSLMLASSYNQFSFNVCRGYLPLFVVGDYQVVNNNTVYQSAEGSATAFLVGLPAAMVSYNYAPFPHNNKIYNNIFVGNSTVGYAYWDYDGQGGNDHSKRGEQKEWTSTCVPSRRNGETDLMNDYMNYNCYWNMSATGRDNNKICKIGSYGGTAADCNSIAAMRAIWATWNTQYGSINDNHSIVADPLFADAANDDLRLLPSSPCLYAGMPTIDGGRSSMGAYQSKSTDYADGDINKDYKVDWKDFALFAESWLQCTDPNQENCP